ncbi:MAG: PIG-L family deacetylase [Actinomycetota bacterium]|nr:PIG-L family deacetylase [Actinomycetota bacterium]
MGTLVSFHAHPDDESIQTGGTMAKAAADGHRVVLVLATRGEHGEVDDGFLEPGESLAERRTAETARSAEVLGAARVVYLDYLDSGMMDTPENDAPGSFWKADLDEAAERLAAVLREEQADVLTIYDDHGGYGHPDHIQVHRVGTRAAQLAGTERVFEATTNRDHMRRILRLAAEAGELPLDEAPDESFIDTLGSPEELITATIDVQRQVQAKRASMAAHASQISESSFFLQLPEEAFASSFGFEWYIRQGAAPGEHLDDLFGALH